MQYAARVVEGISELSEGVLLGERYQLARRLDLFAVGAERVAGVEYEYWIAVDVTSGAEVWIQFAAADGVCAAGSALAGAVSALRRINHPAVPVVPAFGEYEFELDGAIASVGYCAIPTAEGETLAAALARETLEQTEILAALGQVAEVLELLAEFELVHGHLSAHSVLLTALEEQAGYGVVLVDLPASLALETALESELTAAADVYALAWLVVLALIGSSTLEAEFGAGFAVTTELELLAEEVALRRLEWAAENLVVLGVSESLAEVLLLALGEAAGRPRVAVLTAALRAEWAASMVEVEVAAEEVAAEEVATVEVAAVEVAAAEVAAAEVAAVEAVAVEVVETAVVEETAEAAVLAEAVGVMAAESGKTSNKKSNKASKAAVVAGAVAVGAVAAGASAAAAAETEVIPAVKYGTSSASRRAGAGSGAGAAVGTSAAAGYRRAESASAPVGGGSAAGSGAHGAARRRLHPGVLVGVGLGIVIIIVLIISLSSSPKQSATVASGVTSSASAGATGSAGTSSTATASSGAGGSATTTAGSGSSAGASSSATAGAGSGGSTTGSTATTAAGTTTTFPTLLTTVPASASQAVQQISTAVNQASGELSGTEKGQLGQVVSTLNQEISSGQSTSTGVAQLWALLHSGELPSSLNTYLIQLATYLSASQGS